MGIWICCGLAAEELIENVAPIQLDSLRIRGLTALELEEVRREWVL